MLGEGVQVKYVLDWLGLEQSLALFSNSISCKIAIEDGLLKERNSCILGENRIYREVLFPPGKLFLGCWRRQGNKRHSESAPETALANSTEVTH